MLASERTTLTHRLGVVVAVYAVSEVVEAVEDGDVVAVEAESDGDAAADADTEADAVGVGELLVPVAAGVLAVGVAVELLGLGDGEGLEVATVTVSHCWPVTAAGRADSASAGGAVAAASATTDAPVMSMPPASKLFAIGRTRVKHMKMSCPCCSLRRRNDFSV